VNSGTLSDTNKLPPPSREPHLIDGHIQAQGAIDGDLAMVREDGDDVEELLHEHPSLLIGGLGPDLVRVQLSEDAEHIVEASGGLCPARRFFSSSLTLLAEPLDLAREPFLLLREQLGVDRPGIVELQELPTSVDEFAERGLGSPVAWRLGRMAGRG
jgi:hypothetical protein